MTVLAKLKPECIARLSYHLPTNQKLEHRVTEISYVNRYHPFELLSGVIRAFSINWQPDAEIKAMD